MKSTEPLNTTPTPFNLLTGEGDIRACVIDVHTPPFHQHIKNDAPGTFKFYYTTNGVTLQARIDDGTEPTAWCLERRFKGWLFLTPPVSVNPFNGDYEVNPGASLTTPLTFMKKGVKPAEQVCLAILNLLDGGGDSYSVLSYHTDNVEKGKNIIRKAIENLMTKLGSTPTTTPPLALSSTSVSALILQQLQKSFDAEGEQIKLAIIRKTGIEPYPERCHAASTPAPSTSSSAASSSSSSSTSSSSSPSPAPASTESKTTVRAFR